jgi:uncharacterized repeat protein (TIGR02543 family)
LGVKTAYLVSGSGVITEAVQNQLRSLGINIISLGGADRFATAYNIAQEVAKYKNIDTVVVATAYANADALTIASLAAKNGWPILISGPDGLTAGLQGIANNASRSYVIGGTGAVSAAVESGLPAPTRLGGSDRYATNLAVLSYFADQFDYGKGVFLANGADDHLIDALSASAYIAGAPLLLSANGILSAAEKSVLEQITNNPGFGNSVTALGGTGAIADSTLNIVYTAIHDVVAQGPAVDDPNTGNPEAETPATGGGGGGGGSTGGGGYVPPSDGDGGPSVDSYAVTFQLNGEDATGQPPAKTVESGKQVARPADPARPDYVFSGWYTADVSGSLYDFSAAVTGTFTLYAHWSKVVTGGDFEDLFDGKNAAEIDTDTTLSDETGFITVGSDGEQTLTVASDTTVTVAVDTTFIVGDEGDVEVEGALVVKGDLEVKDGGKVAVQGSLTVEGDLLVEEDGKLEVAGELIVKGNLTVENFADDLDLTDGKITVEAGGSVTLGSETFVGNDEEATIQLQTGGEFTLRGAPGSSTTTIGGQAAINGIVGLIAEDQAIITGDVTIIGIVSLNGGADLSVEDGGSLEVANRLDVDEASSVTVASGARLTVAEDGTLGIAKGGSLIIEGELIIAGEVILDDYEDLDLSSGKLTAKAGAYITIDSGVSAFVGGEDDEAIIELIGTDTEFSLAGGPGARMITIDGVAAVNGELGLYSADKATISGELTIADGGEVTLHGTSALEITEGTLTVGTSGTLTIGSVDEDKVTLTVAADATLIIVGDLTLGNGATLNVAGTLVLPKNLPDNERIGSGTINFTAGAVLDASLATGEENAGLDWISDLVKGLPEGVTIKHSVTSLLATMGLDEFGGNSPAAEYVSTLEDELEEAHIYLKRNSIASEPGDGTDIVTLLDVYTDLNGVSAYTLGAFLTPSE